MSLTMDKAFGILPAAVSLQARRTELLASNIANADTPHYKSRDFDFNGIMRAVADEGKGMQLTRTQSDHMELPGHTATETPELLYRIPSQPALDGNTVDQQLERAAFAENSMRYQSSLEFLNRRVSGIRAALRRE